MKKRDAIFGLGVLLLSGASSFGAPSILQVTQDKPFYLPGDRASLVIQENSWPQDPAFRISLDAALDGASVALLPVGEHLFSYLTLGLSPAAHVFTVSAYLENKQQIDADTQGINLLAAEAIELRKEIQNTSDPVLLAKLQARLSQVVAESAALTAKITGERSLLETKTIALTADNPPQISVSPESGALIRVDTPTFTVSYSDPASGLDLTKLHILLDGVDLTSRAVVSSTQAVLQFTQAFPLASGVHQLQVQIFNHLGQASTLSGFYTVDTGLVSQGYIVGYVVDRNNSPISGVSISSTQSPVRAGLSGTTDATGKYTLPFTTPGNYQLQIQADGYTFAIRQISVVSGRDSVVDTAILSPSDPKVTAISQALGGIANNSDGSVVLNVPAGAAPGNLSFSATTYTSGNQLPGPLPELSQFTYAHENDVSITSRFAVGYGVPFSQAGGMSLTNTLGFPPGVSLATGSYDSSTGTWSDLGDATVSPNGSSISYSFSTLFPAHDSNQPVVVPLDDLVPSPVEFAGGGANSPPSPPECPGCRINLDTGNLAEDVSLPPVVRLGQNYGLSFSYNSTAAYPTAFVGSAFSSLVAVPYWVSPAVSAHPPILRNIPPDETAVDIKFGSQEVTARFDQTAATSFSYQRVIFNAKNAAGQLLQTGSYPYTGTFTSFFSNSQYAAAAYFGAPPGIALGVIPKEPVQLRGSLSGRIVVQNQVLSPFGAGWTLNGLEQLNVDPEGTALWTDGTGTLKVFTPLGSSTGMMRTMSQLPSSGEISGLTESAGFIYAASCQANQVYRIDLQGRSTVLAGSGTAGFAGDGRLATEAQLNCPMAIIPARAGGFYIADSGNLRVRKILTDGTITTWGGNGSISPGPDGTLASQTGIGRPLSLAEDKLQALFFTTSGDDIRIIDPRQKLRTYASANAGYVKVALSHPTQVLFDVFDNPIVVDSGNDQIVKLLPQTGANQVLVGGSSKSANVVDFKTGRPPGLTRPVGLAYDSGLKRYFIHEKSGRLLMWNGPGTQRLVVVGKSTAQAMTFSPEKGLVLGSGGSLQLGMIEASRRGSRVGAATPVQYAPPAGEFSRLVHNIDGSFTRSLVGGTVVNYDAQGYITNRMDPGPRNTIYQYGPGHLLTLIIIPEGSSYQLSYDSRGYLSQITDPANRVTRFVIDDSGNVTQIVQADLTSKNFAYDATHLLQTEKDEVGHAKAFTYRFGRITSETLPNGKTQTVAPSALLGLINDIQNPANAAPAVTPATVQASMVSPEGRTTSFKLNQLGESNQTQTGTFNPTTLTQDMNGLTTQVTTPAGRVVSMTYDAQGRLLTQINASGLRTYAYDPVFGKLASVTDQDGKTVSLSYTSSGNLASTTDQLGGVTQFTYFPDGALQSTTDALGNVSQFTEDAYGNVASSQDPLGRTTHFLRDTAGSLLQTTDPQGNVSHSQFDPLGRLIQTLDALNGVTLFSRNPDGTLGSLTDAKGQATLYSYNPLSLVSSMTDALKAVEGYAYDNDQNLVKKTTRNGGEVDYVFDDTDRLTTKTAYPQAGNLAGAVQTNYTMDADGLLTEVNNASTQVGLTYDPLGRLTSDMQKHLTGIPVQYAYSADGRVSEMFYGTDIDVKYQYEARGLLSQMTATLFGQNFQWQRTWDALGRPEQDYLPNGQVVKYAFDAAGQLIDIQNLISNSASLLSEFGYGYASTGNVSTLNEVIGGLGNSTPAKTQLGTYGYDALNRLTSSTTPDESFGYDPVGNRTEGGQQYDGDNRLLQDGEFVFASDANGNVLSKQNKKTGERTEYAWNPENQLFAVTIKSDGTNPSKQIAYLYDGQGRRVQRAVTDLVDASKSYIRRFLYDGQRIIEELDGNGKVVAAYLHGAGVDDPLVMLRDVNGDGTFNPATEVFYYTKDSLGSIRDLTDASGTLQQRYRYSAYGVTKVERDQGTVVSQSFIENPFAYTGRELEQETGDYFYRARYYSPATAKFLSSDPIGFAGGDKNLFRYVFNNPLIFSDPTGKVCTFNQGTGQFTCWNGPSGPDQPYLNTTGYSGASPSINNPGSQGIPNGGVTPGGTYSVGSPGKTTSGVAGLPLIPDPSSTCPPGRNCNSIWIHGGRPGHSASTGCIIINNPARGGIPTGETVIVVP